MNLRVTKYNPALRNEDGVYYHDDWTSSSDIGKQFGGKILTIEEYLKVENRYIQFICELLSMIKVDALKIIEFENYMIEKECCLSEKCSSQYYEISKLAQDSLRDDSIKLIDSLVGDSPLVNSVVERNDICSLARLCLRELLWIKFLGESNLYIHFGYDYYMYCGIDNPLYKIDDIMVNGIYAEHYLSPYRAPLKIRPIGCE